MRGVWLGERERRGRKCVSRESMMGGVGRWREQHRTTRGGVRDRERDERLGVT